MEPSETIQALHPINGWEETGPLSRDMLARYIRQVGEKGNRMAAITIMYNRVYQFAMSPDWGCGVIIHSDDGMQRHYLGKPGTGEEFVEVVYDYLVKWNMAK